MQYTTSSFIYKLIHTIKFLTPVTSDHQTSSKHKQSQLETNNQQFLGKYVKQEEVKLG